MVVYVDQSRRGINYAAHSRRSERHIPMVAHISFSTGDWGAAPPWFHGASLPKQGPTEWKKLQPSSLLLISGLQLVLILCLLLSKFPSLSSVTLAGLVDSPGSVT